MVKKGVDRYTFGKMLAVIYETCSFPSHCELKKTFTSYLKDVFPIKKSLIRELRELTNYRNDYAHVPGQIITNAQYFKFRYLIIEIINFLRINLSEPESHQGIPQPLESLMIN